jgi:hypothetical protein
MAHDFLEEHNAYRAEVGCASLVWDVELAKVKKCTLQAAAIDIVAVIYLAFTIDAL